MSNSRQILYLCDLCGGNIKENLVILEIKRKFLEQLSDEMEIIEPSEDMKTLINLLKNYSKWELESCVYMEKKVHLCYNCYRKFLKFLEGNKNELC